MTGREDSSTLSEILFRARFKEEITVFTTKGVFSFTIFAKVRKFLPTIKLFQISVVSLYPIKRRKIPKLHLQVIFLVYQKFYVDILSNCNCITKEGRTDTFFYSMFIFSRNSDLTTSFVRLYAHTYGTIT